MKYKHLKVLLIAVTVLVWLRLFAGTFSWLGDPSPALWKNQVVATEKENWWY